MANDQAGHPISNGAPVKVKGLSNTSRVALRTLRVLQVLTDRTGESKTISAEELMAEISEPRDRDAMPLPIGRRTLTSSISALRAAGYVIEYRRGAGYRLSSRPLSDEDIVRLHTMVMRNRTIPSDVRHNLATRLVKLASADIRSYLEHPPSPPQDDPKTARQHRKRKQELRVSACELIEAAIGQGVAVAFDLAPQPGAVDDTHTSCTMRPYALRQREDTYYVLGTVADGSASDDTLRTLQIDRLRNIRVRLLDGRKLMAVNDTSENEEPSLASEEASCEGHAV